MDESKRQSLIELMKPVILFKYLDDEMLDEVLGISEVVQLEGKQRIIEQGDIDPHLYVVLTGSVSVSVSESSGQDVYVAAIGAGDVFGEAGMFIKSRRTANITTMSDSTLLRIHRQKFIQFVKQRPSAGIKMLMIIIFSLLRKLKESNTELAFERKAQLDQDDIDSLIDGFMKE